MFYDSNTQPADGQGQRSLESKPRYQTSSFLTFNFKNLLLNEQKNPTLLGHIILSFCLIGCFAIGDIVTSQFAANKQKKWLSVPDPRVKVILSNDNFYYYDPNELIKKMLVNYQTTEKEKSEQQKETLRIYYLNMAARAFVHSDVLSYCYTRTFVTITLITFSALLASLCLFFISRVGWERTNNALINIFVICAGIVVTYGGLAVGLDYEKNIKENQKLYAAYTNLQSETLRFLATGRSKDGKSVSTSDYIIYVDDRLAEFSAVSLDFNTDEILKYRENVIKTINSNGQVKPDTHQ